MFMRNRGHTCDMCSHIDEHHYKRHFEICEQVRSIYEQCGEDWPLIPEDEDDRGRSIARGSDAFDKDGGSSTLQDLPLRKRDKKEHKRQMRAASRTKVVTQEDVKYIDSILHPVADEEGVVVPVNAEEIDEIERHLKYNAQCYNHGQKRSKLRHFARIPDADIDFGAEIDRVFEILRVNELLKRNDRNRGLRNKELANFNMIVSDLKGLIITDLVQNKKDELEIRMRRAAFLRYANRTGYDIVDDRYADKDWKTGEKFRSTGSGSASSDCLTVVEEDAEEDELADRLLRNFSAATLHDADRRHIEFAHKKLSSDGTLEEIETTQEARDLPAVCFSKPPPSLRIVNTNIVPPRSIRFHDPWNKPRSSVTKPSRTVKLHAQDSPMSELVDKESLPENDDEWQVVGPTTIPKNVSKGRTDTPRAKSVPTLQTSQFSSPYKAPPAPWHALKPTRVGVTGWMDQGEADRRKMAEKMDQEEKQA